MRDLSHQAPGLTVAHRPPPRVVFHRILGQGRLPQRADRSAAGSLPTRAFRYCEPITSASAFGYYVFPPIDFSLRWDGFAVSWTFKGAAEWMPLGSAQFPGFSAVFDQHAPEAVRGFAPPFLSAVQEPGLVQVWSGLIVRTAPDVSLLLRAPANLPNPGGYELFEGIVETDRWFGPLFGALRLTRTHQPVAFSADYPLFQAQPLPRAAYADSRLDDFELTAGVEDLTAADWRRYYETVVRPSGVEPRLPGHNAIASRKRRADDANKA